MLWCSIPELDLCLGLLMVILYGLTSLRHKHVSLSDVHFFCQSWPLLLIFSYLCESGALFYTGPLPFTELGFTSLPSIPLIDGSSLASESYNLSGSWLDYSFDILLCLLTCAILLSFKSFESLLLIMMAYIGQALMLHSCDLVSFYVCLEGQNFCFLVLCGLQPDRLERSLKSASSHSHEASPRQLATISMGLKPKGPTPLFNELVVRKANSASNPSIDGIEGNEVNPNSVKGKGRLSFSSFTELSSGHSSGFSVESSIKYLLLSAFSSGMCLFWFSALYLRTGMSVLFFKMAATENEMDLSLIKPATSLSDTSFFNESSAPTVELQFESFQILLALMFKLGNAPIHLWVVDIYQSIKKPLLMYISTAPKLSLFCFWVSSWHQVWTDFSVGIFICFSMILGSIGAYGQPALRALFAYSTINEIGLMLLAIETAGFHTLFQHLCIYICTQLLLWNLEDKRLFSLTAVSLAGLPPLAGFFGKAWIFWHAMNSHLLFLMAVALFCTGLSLVYYLRVIRLFWPFKSQWTSRKANNAFTRGEDSSSSRRPLRNANQPVRAHHLDARFDNSMRAFTSACAIVLGFLPLFLVKPFVL